MCIECCTVEFQLTNACLRLNMKKILAVLALTTSLAGCVIDDGYGYYDDYYYGPGYGSGYGYTNSYTTINNYRYYDTDRRIWVTRSPADQKKYWDNNKKPVNQNHWNRKPDNDRHNAKPKAPPPPVWTQKNIQDKRRAEQNRNPTQRSIFKKTEQPRPNLPTPKERNIDKRRIEQQQNSPQRPAFNKPEQARPRIERTRPNQSSSRERSIDNRPDIHNRNNPSRQP